MAHAEPSSSRLVPVEAWPGIVLLLTSIAAMLIVNSPWAPLHNDLMKTVISLSFGSSAIALTVTEWVKNLLMAIFFFYAGLELKREMKEGTLSSPSRALLPLLAAAGGVVLPALIYLAIADPAGYGHGWAIPAATDIAFALGVLALLGSRVPGPLKAFLLAVAVVDDLAAILIVAFFYSDTLRAEWLLWVLAFYAPMLMLNQLRVGAVGLYILLAVPLWIAMQNSGVNPTIAGVLAALAIPMRDKGGQAVLVHVEHGLRPYVLFGVMPVFALASAGAVIEGDLGAAMGHPVTLGILLGLLVGKPVGITVMTYVGSLVLKAERPGGLGEIVGLGFIAGIGFTMSLFIGKLAFKEPGLETMIKLGVYGGSILSAAIGLALLGAVLRRRTAAETAAEVDETDIFIGDERLRESHRLYRDDHSG
jgi:NhaA family Na+:H+ antiporter